MKKKLNYILSYVAGQLIEKKRSEISGELEVWYQNGRYVLHSKNANYSYDTLHKVFQQAFRQFKIKDRKLKNALILGFGGGSVASILSEELKMRLEMVGVEADLAVLELAHKYFSIDRFKNLKIINEDAAMFVNRHREKYDLIVCDVFQDKQVPDSIQREEFIEELIGLTSPGGIGFYNFIAETNDQKKQRSRLLTYFEKLSIPIISARFSSINNMVVWENRQKRIN